MKQLQIHLAWLSIQYLQRRVLFFFLNLSFVELCLVLFNTIFSIQDCICYLKLTKTEDSCTPDSIEIGSILLGTGSGPFSNPAVPG